MHNTEFQTSSYCKTDEGMCVAVRVDANEPAIKDTKPGAIGVLAPNRESFTALLATLKIVT